MKVGVALAVFGGVAAVASLARHPSVPPVPEAGFARLGPPRPGEWRARFDEAPQSIEDYAARGANRRSPGRSAVVIQPLGETAASHRETLELMREYAEIFLGLPARIADPIPMFENGYVPQRGQYNSTMIIGQLAERVPPDALVHMGITDHDLFSRGLNFVFGEGNLSNRCGVYSLHRYRTPDRELFVRQALKLMTHEAGHILSVHHCVAWKCVMQGANSLEEDDRHPLHLCPEDLRKLEWNSGFDQAARYRALSTFFLPPNGPRRRGGLGRRPPAMTTCPVPPGAPRRRPSPCLGPRPA